MAKIKMKKVGFKVLVYWYDQESPDVLVLHRFTEKALYMWIDGLLSDVGNSVTHVVVKRFYY